MIVIIKCSAKPQNAWHADGNRKWAIFISAKSHRRQLCVDLTKVTRVGARSCKSMYRQRRSPQVCEPLSGCAAWNNKIPGSPFTFTTGHRESVADCDSQRVGKRSR
ncbi:hypothetical protein TRVL_05242 [Trypanosoma vivax]|nr:hypothetical protein TRVL_05242 [Trypanosoma vivax]